MFEKKSVLKNFAKLTGKQLCWSLFKNKVADRHQNKNKLSCSHYTFLIYKQLGSGHSPQSCLYFQGFWGLQLLSGLIK